MITTVKTLLFGLGLILALSHTVLAKPNWQAGLRHPQFFAIRSADSEGYWLPDPGFMFPQRGSLEVRWQAGLRMPGHSYVVSGEEIGSWLPVDGYCWVNQYSRDFRVREIEAMPNIDLDGSWSGFLSDVNQLDRRAGDIMLIGPKYFLHDQRALAVLRQRHYEAQVRMLKQLASNSSTSQGDWINGSISEFMSGSEGSITEFSKLDPESQAKQIANLNRMLGRFGASAAAQDQRNAAHAYAVRQMEERGNRLARSFASE